MTQKPTGPEQGTLEGTTPVSTDRHRPDPWTGQLVMLSLVVAVTVSIIYLPQPMLGEFARGLGISTEVAGTVATSAQIGYAIGIFLFVPLSERIQPRRQITLQIILLAAGLVITALLPGIVSVASGFVAIGLVANIAQLVMPTAGKLSPVDSRGATTATLVGAMLSGIFGGRILASLLMDLIGWRWVLVVFAGAVLALIPLVRRAIPARVALSASGSSYGSLLRSTLRLAVTSRVLRQSSLIQFFSFATFNSIWTVATLYLMSDRWGFSQAQAGLFGLLGLAAGLLTPLSGRLIDRWGTLPVIGVYASTLVVAAAVMVPGAQVLTVFAVTVFILTFVHQSMQAANQNRVLMANPTAAGQANTLFMVLVFLGGSAGAFLGPLAYHLAGMTGVALQAVVLTALALLTWIWARVTSRAEA